MDSYKKLDLGVQKWLHRQGWQNLREIQSKALQPILDGDRDVIISASTAAGKTEAFFLPACSKITDQEHGFGILYVSPLKALINDQFRRLESLCKILDMKATPWHGDVSQSVKKKAEKDPSGILLITPESLESLLIRKLGWVSEAFGNLKYICIDEFHTFIDSERGIQLLSLLNRLEHLLGRLNDPIPRVALSATLGKLEKVPLSLRPNQSLPCTTISSNRESSQIRVQVKGFINPANIDKDELMTPVVHAMCQDIYDLCRGSSHLVFSNSRRLTESISAKLADMSEQNGVPNEFFPHHGSLAKELREDLESRLQREMKPTTAICTSTLELGIDIGKVDSVVQVEVPHSVSSLQQRLGRSGRRENPSTIRMFIPESELTINSDIVDRLRLHLVQSLAMIRLRIIDTWCEPADSGKMHLSTLLHQILALISQWGSIRADQLYSLLCEQRPFQDISVSEFKELLIGMNEKMLIQQLGSKELVLGWEGERVVNSYTFYAVFHTPEEYRVITGSKNLGTIPFHNPVIVDQPIIFAGRRWRVKDIDEKRKVILVDPLAGGKPPLFSDTNVPFVHDRIRQEMYKIYQTGDYRIGEGARKIDFADANARELFLEGLDFFNRAELEGKIIYDEGDACYLLPWMGDKIANTLRTLLSNGGFRASISRGVITILNASSEEVKSYLWEVANGPLPNETELAESLTWGVKLQNKYDEYIPLPLLSVGYGKATFNPQGTRNWILTNLSPDS